MPVPVPVLYPSPYYNSYLLRIQRLDKLPLRPPPPPSASLSSSRRPPFRCIIRRKSLSTGNHVDDSIPFSVYLHRRRKVARLGIGELSINLMHGERQRSICSTSTLPTHTLYVGMYVLRRSAGEEAFLLFY